MRNQVRIGRKREEESFFFFHRIFTNVYFSFLGEITLEFNIHREGV